MIKKFARNGKSCQEVVDDFDNRMTSLKKNYPNIVTKVKTVHGCQFTQFLKGKYMPEFQSSFLKSDLYKEKQYFTRLTARECCLPGRVSSILMSISQIDIRESSGGLTVSKNHTYDFGLIFCNMLKDSLELSF